VYQAVERREQRRAAREGPVGVPVQVGRVDAPLALDALDLRRLACGLTDDARLRRRLRAGGAGDAEGGEPAPVPLPRGFGWRENRVVGVDPSGQVPQPLPALAAGDRDPAAPLAG
jgi:hypothetical protein